MSEAAGIRMPRGRADEGLRRPGGGFTGLVTQTVVDSDSLPAEDREALQARVESVRSEGSRGQSDAPSAYADEASVRVEIEDESGSETVTAGEGHLSPGLRALVNWVTSSPHREEQVLPPGS